MPGGPLNLPHDTRQAIKLPNLCLKVNFGRLERFVCRVLGVDTAHLRVPLLAIIEPAHEIIINAANTRVVFCAMIALSSP